MEPASIKKLEKTLDFLPCIWADADDFILLADNTFVRASNKKETATSAIVSQEINQVEPWGWDAAIRHRLLKLGIDNRLLPDDNEIEKTRRLSHRRISIQANKEMKSPFVPIEIFTVEDAVAFWKERDGLCYFKMPLSGGGRGVLACSELNETQVRQWVGGGIRKQGSLLAENEIERAIDFASLWTVRKSEVIFEGYSISMLDGRGKYRGNVSASRHELLKIIRKKTEYDLAPVIELQHKFIASEIMPHFIGKIGIDMAADKRGRIYPCVEINLRRTMGHVALEYARLPEGKRKNIDISKFPIIPLDSL